MGVSTSTTRTEADLRAEIHKILFGNIAEGVIAKGRPLVIRRFRRDENNRLLPCSCLTGSNLAVPQHTPNRCRFCDGEGHFFDDVVVVGYLQFDYPTPFATTEQPYGQIEPIAPMAYFEYNVEVDEKDKLIEPITDLEGKLPNGPIKIRRVFSISQALEKRSDHGRVEYILCRLTEGHTP
jgi:hypothetical protein